VLFYFITLTILIKPNIGVYMERITEKKGMEMFPLVWTVFPSTDTGVFVNPFFDRPLRHRCFFEKSKGLTKQLTVFFHLNEEEDSGLFRLSEVFLYGAFNEITVHQLRVFGKIREMDRNERSGFIKIIKNRLAGHASEDQLPLMPTIQEKEKALKKLQGGRFYRFDPLYYDHGTYERG